jgi:hypothetical protein
MKLYKTEHMIQSNVMNCKTWKELEDFLSKYLEMVRHHELKK